jgi:hypothetical protein
MLYNFYTAVLTAIGAVTARPACITVFPTLCSGRCVPFVMACDMVATSRSFKLGEGTGVGVGLGIG